ncbi:hypothetical protein [Aurantimonas endophytica]|uniref:Uncharacterized protein n=1 Tax=Aurantimonas endophytica TaxID=1522175 RepID=A0A7W6HCD6_9HYPH|nr:hypothetical protein [Aurantimonas endophytica]MBB4002368.1 hypothetical protein [Aurantimonas endophytica]MCO6402009.1 hypothetical protein [Aurantimonas endophytica]
MKFLKALYMHHQMAPSVSMPLFSDEDGQQWFKQEIDSGHRVQSFVPLNDIEPGRVKYLEQTVTSERPLMQGDFALYAINLSDHEISIGTFQNIKSKFRLNLIDKSILQGSPFLSLELAHFLQDRAWQQRAAVECAASLERVSEGLKRKWVESIADQPYAEYVNINDNSEIDESRIVNLNFTATIQVLQSMTRYSRNVLGKNRSNEIYRLIGETFLREDYQFDAEYFVDFADEYRDYMKSASDLQLGLEYINEAKANIAISPDDYRKVRSAADSIMPSLFELLEGRFLEFRSLMVPFLYNRNRCVGTLIFMEYMKQNPGFRRYYFDKPILSFYRHEYQEELENSSRIRVIRARLHEDLPL